MKPKKRGFVGFVGSDQGHIQKFNADIRQRTKQHESDKYKTLQVKKWLINTR